MSVDEQDRSMSKGRGRTPAPRNRYSAISRSSCQIHVIGCGPARYDRAYGGQRVGRFLLPWVTEKGAFTGANQRHAGRFEVANHGTISSMKLAICRSKPRSPCCACSRNANSSGLEIRKTSQSTFEFSVEKAWLSKESEPRNGPRPTIANSERDLIEAALAESHGKVAGPDGAARKLGIARTTLESRIKSLRINQTKSVCKSEP